MAPTEAPRYDLIVSLVLYNPNLTHLKQTLESLYSSDVSFKLCVVDNSPVAADKEFFSNYDNLSFFHSPVNLGYGRGHNHNIRNHAREGRYFLVLNPDIYFAPNLLHSLIYKMDADRQVGLSIPRVCHPCGTHQLVNRRLPRPQDYLISFLQNKFKISAFSSSTYEKYLLKDMDLNRSMICPTISGCFMMVRTNVLLDVGGFDERYFLYLEDTDLSRRIAILYKTVVFTDLVAFHHWSRGAYQSPLLFARFVRNLIRYFSKWGWFFDKERDLLNRSVGYYVPPANGSATLSKQQFMERLH